MGGNVVDAYDPASGRRLWELPGLLGGRTDHRSHRRGRFCLRHGGLSEGRSMPSSSAACLPGRPAVRDGLEILRFDARHVLPGRLAAVAVYHGFRLAASPRVSTPARANANGGIGLASRNFKSSPMAADGHVYFLGHDGQCTVVEASRDFRIVAQNSLDDEFTASPAISDGRIYLRGRKIAVRDREMTVPGAATVRERHDVRCAASGVGVRGQKPRLVFDAGLRTPDPHADDFHLVPKLCLGTHFREAPPTNKTVRFITGSRASGKCVTKQSLVTRKSPCAIVRHSVGYASA